MKSGMGPGLWVTMYSVPLVALEMYNLCQYLAKILGGDFGRILRASKTILALRYVLADKKLFWKGFGVRYGDQLVS